MKGSLLLVILLLIHNSLAEGSGKILLGLGTAGLQPSFQHIHTVGTIGQVHQFYQQAQAVVAVRGQPYREAHTERIDRVIAQPPEFPFGTEEMPTCFVDVTPRNRAADIDSFFSHLFLFYHRLRRFNRFGLRVVLLFHRFYSDYCGQGRD